MGKSENSNPSVVEGKDQEKSIEAVVIKKKPSKVLVISVFSSVLIVASLILLFVTGVIGIEGINKGICEYMEEVYEDGESFRLEDGCNTCTCEGSTGLISCTEISCASEDRDTGNDAVNDDVEEEGNMNDEETTGLQLPSNIFEEQVYKEFTLRDIRFLVYIRENMNYPLENSNGVSGVLYAEPEGVQWKSFLTINELDTSKNNIFYFGYDERINGYILLLIDDNGAGSGEGIAKVVGLNQSEDSWDTLECFYFIPEHWTLDDISNLRQEVEIYLENNPQYIQPSGAESCSNFEVVEG